MFRRKRGLLRYLVNTVNEQAMNFIQPVKICLLSKCDVVQSAVQVYVRLQRKDFRNILLRSRNRIKSVVKYLVENSQ